jgi:hypothetical protein
MQKRYFWDEQYAMYGYNTHCKVQCVGRPKMGSRLSRSLDFFSA